jgi:hypothetical protein
VSACVRALVDAHFAGSIRAGAERAMRGHLAECDACRGYYERHLVLAALDPQAKSAEERIGVALGLRPPRARFSAAPLAWGACALAVALAVFLSRPRHAAMEEIAEYTARGASSLEAEPRIFAYRMEPRERIDGASASIGEREALAFAYTNARRYEHLLVFGVDEHRHVYWYYPAWIDAQQDPRAVAIGGGTEMRELPQAVRHDLDGSQLTIHAVFTHRDPSVKEVEALVAGQDPEAATFEPNAGGAFEQRISLRVER